MTRLVNLARARTIAFLCLVGATVITGTFTSSHVLAGVECQGVCYEGQCDLWCPGIACDADPFFCEDACYSVCGEEYTVEACNDTGEACSIVCQCTLMGGGGEE